MKIWAIEATKKGAFLLPFLFLCFTRPVISFFFFLTVYPRAVQIPSEEHGTSSQKDDCKKSRPGSRFYTCQRIENANDHASYDSRHGVNVGV